jgi:hypothetical protein
VVVLVQVLSKQSNYYLGFVLKLITIKKEKEKKSFEHHFEKDKACPFI